MKADTHNLHKMGLCANHFDPGDFNTHTNSDQPQLKKSAVPRKFDVDTRFTNFILAMSRGTKNLCGVQLSRDKLFREAVRTLECEKERSEKDAEISRLKAEIEKLNKVNASQSAQIAEKNQVIRNLQLENAREKREHRKSKVYLAKSRQLRKKGKFELHRTRYIIRRLKEQLSRKDMRIKALEERLKNNTIDGLGVDDWFKKHNVDTPMARTIVLLQMRNKCKPYTQAEKNFAQQFYYYSASAYSHMRDLGFKLPSVKSVNRWVSQTKMDPGINCCIMESLEKRLSKLKPCEKVGGVKFDEIFIRSKEEYNKFTDVVEGLVDFGGGWRRNERAKHILVFFFDSINGGKPYREFIGYYCTGKGGASASELKKVLDSVLDALKKIGADVRVIACDQGANNSKLYKDYLGFSVDSALNGDVQYYQAHDKKYILTFDFPHLIKRLVYALRKHKIIWDTNGKILVDFYDFVKVYQYDRLVKTSRALPKITHTHIAPNNFQSMNVKRAFQLLGGAYAAAIRVAASDPDYIHIGRIRWKAALNLST